MQQGSGVAKISVLYHHFPHYRAPVMRAMASSNRHSYHFFGGHNDFQGIKAFRGDDQVPVTPITFTGDEKTGHMVMADYGAALTRDFDATIIIGHLKVRATWAAEKMAHRNGLKVAYWAHGWLRKEIWPKAKLRNHYFGKADRVLVYSTRAVGIAAATGFDPERISVVYNSLDWETQSRQFHAIEGLPQQALRAELGLPTEAAILLTISRVTDICRYDWLIEAARQINTGGRPLCIVMIGAGPALEGLKEKAVAAGIDLRSTGALYDEERIARHVMAADVVVSPGKVGLTAMHALAYGTPVVTHGALDLQMPEIEAVEEGRSGALFPHGSIPGLAAAIDRVLAFGGDLASRRQACRAALEGRFTPQDQCRLIDDAVDRMLHG